MATLHGAAAGESATPSQQPDSAAKRKREQWQPSEEEQFFDSLRVLRAAGEGDDRRGGVTAISTAISRAIGTKDVDQVRFYYYRLVKRIDALLPPRKKLRRDDPESLHKTMLAFWDTFCAQGLRGSSTHILGRRPGKRQKLSTGLEKSLAGSNAANAAAAAAAAGGTTAGGAATTMTGKMTTAPRGNKENASPPPSKSKSGKGGRPKAEAAAAAVLQQFRPPSVASGPTAAAAAATPLKAAATTTAADNCHQRQHPRLPASAGASPDGSVGAAPSTSTAPGSACRGEKLGLQLVPADTASGDAVVAAGGVPMLELICRPKKALSTVAGHLAAKWRVPVPVPAPVAEGSNKRKKKNNGATAAAAATTATTTTSGVALALPLPSSPNSAASGAPPRSWRLDTTGMTVGELYERLGRPNPFRVTYALLEAPAAAAAPAAVLAAAPSSGAFFPHSAAAAAAAAPGFLDYQQHEHEPAPSAGHAAHGPGWMNPPPSSPHETPAGGRNAGGGAAGASTPYEDDDGGDPAAASRQPPPHSTAQVSTFLAYLQDNAFNKGGGETMGVPLPPGVGGEENENGDGGGNGGGADAAAAVAANDHHQPAPPSLFAPDLSLGSILRASGADLSGPTTFAGLTAGLPKPNNGGANANAPPPRLSFEARLQAAANAGGAAPPPPPSSSDAAPPPPAGGVSEVPPPPPMSLLGALPGGTRGGGGRVGGEEEGAATDAAATGAPAGAGGGGVGALGTATVQAFESLADGLGSLLGAPGDSWLAGPPQVRNGNNGGAAAAPAAAQPLGPRPFGALFPSPPGE